MSRLLVVFAFILIIPTGYVKAQIPETFNCEGAFLEDPDQDGEEIYNVSLSVNDQSISIADAESFTGSYARKPSDPPAIAFSDSLLPTEVAGVFNADTGYLEIYKYATEAPPPADSRKAFLFAYCAQSVAE